MAKQSGIHQLRGKVGEHSYYRQTGVQGGLVRAINPAMSNRVKTDPAFANTRLNNAEFGQGGRIASVLARFINPKYRPMVLPFSQAKMAKVILDYIKTDDSEWGQRNLKTNDIVPASLDALNLVSKNRFEDFGLGIEINTENNTAHIVLGTQAANKLNSIGADGLMLTIVCAAPWVGHFLPSENKYFESYGRATRVTEDGIVADDELTLNFTTPTPPPVDWPVDFNQFLIFIVLPFRTVGSAKYILQEHCTYKATEFEDGPIV